jgi:hypothetical protein
MVTMIFYSNVKLKREINLTKWSKKLKRMRIEVEKITYHKFKLKDKIKNKL